MPHRIHSSRYRSPNLRSLDNRPIATVRKIKLETAQAPKESYPDNAFDVPSIIIGACSFVTSGLLLSPGSIDKIGAMPFTGSMVGGACLAGKIVVDLRKGFAVKKATAVFASVCGLVGGVGFSLIGGTPLLVSAVAGAAVTFLTSAYERQLQIESEKSENPNKGLIITGSTILFGAAASLGSISTMGCIKSFFGF